MSGPPYTRGGGVPSKLPLLDANHLHVWKCGDAAGNLVDAGGSTLAPVNLVPTALAVYQADGPLGAKCPYWGDDGTGAAVNSYAAAPIAAFSDLPASNVTLEAYVFQRKRGAAQLFGVSFAGSYRWDVQLDGSGFTMTSNFSTFANVANTIVTTDYGFTFSPHHVMATYDGAHATLYVDGEQIIQSAQTGAIPWATGAGTPRIFLCGDPNNTIQPFVGFAQYFMLSNVARSRAYARNAYKTLQGW